ncbi:glycosyltransferase [Patescibacteria group bacterium]
MRDKKKISVVIPLYNEELRFEKGFKVCKGFANRFPGWEFIFVNDGSTDKTKQLVKKAIKDKSAMRLISYEKNQGKGYALKQGVKEAVKPLILICDIDFSTPLSELTNLYPFIKKAEVVIGSRKVQGANILKHQPKMREWLGKQFTNLSKLVLRLKVSDVTCGFKLFKKQAGKKLFGLSRIKRWGYDAEILFLAKKHKMKMVDVPVTWQNDERTKVSMVRDIIQSLIDLWLIRWNDLLGNYSTEAMPT